MSRPRVAVHSTTADSDIIEICAAAGAAAYFVDLEHGPAGIRDSIGAIRAAQSVGLEMHFRVAVADLTLASRLTDGGADGVHFADVRTPSEVELATGAVFHPPIGRRGYGGCRRNGYGISTGGREAVPLVGIQLESRQAIEHIDELLAPGVGMVSVGTRDLAADLGHGGQLEHPEVEAAVDLVAGKARSAGVEVAAMARSARQYRAAVEQGAGLILIPLASLLQSALMDYLASKSSSEGHI